jgi:nucleoside-diphosphate-sugar epimerase
MTKRALIVGCGYTGERLGHRLLEEGLSVHGTTRSEARGRELAAAGIDPVVGDLADTETVRRLGRSDPAVVFYLVPPQRSEHDPLEAVLRAMADASPEGFVYGSSTSVYGDRGGAWVDETSPVDLGAERARARYQAERTVIEAWRRHEIPVRICRIAGIYGPGRTLHRSLAAGEYLLIRDRDTWVNRIHVDDLAAGLAAAWRNGAAGRVYNLVDDEPHRSSDFARLAARLQRLPEPQWVDESEAAERYGERRLRRKLSDKRVSNRRAKEELDLDLAYPSFRVGLPAAVEAVVEEERRER